MTLRKAAITASVENASKDIRQGLLPKVRGGLQSFMAALRQRMAKAIGVIDDALTSENFKERTWAVDQILKYLKPAAEAKTKKTAKKPVAEPAVSALKQELSALSQEELLARLRHHLQEAAEGEAEAYSDDDEEEG